MSTHWAVALRILRGEADVGVATRAVATALSLGFVPLTRERFDLVVPKESFFRSCSCPRRSPSARTMGSPC
jgi:putative molybdopterin biosynthesis protein